MAASPARHRWAPVLRHAAAESPRPPEAPEPFRRNLPVSRCQPLPDPNTAQPSAVPAYSPRFQFQGRVEPQYFAGHLGIAVEPSPMQRRRSHLSRRIHRPTRLQHQPDCFGVVVLRGVRQLSLVRLRQCLRRVRMLREKFVKHRFVAQFACQRQLELLRSALHAATERLLRDRNRAPPSVRCGARPASRCKWCRRRADPALETTPPIRSCGCSRDRCPGAAAPVPYRRAPRPSRCPSGIRVKPGIELHPAGPADSAASARRAACTAPASIRDPHRAHRSRRRSPAGTPQPPRWKQSAAASVHLRRVRGPRSGSAATSSRSFGIIPSRAAECASNTAPRSIRNSTMPGSQSSSTPKPPAHHSVRFRMSAPARSSTSIVARSLRCTAANNACWPKP